MLTEICDFVHNYFEKAVYSGTFTIADGTIPMQLTEGQRFKIRGSNANDGIYTYSADGILNDDGDSEVALTSETFTGTITAMSMPEAFLRIAREISDWVDANNSVVTSPYQSESFGGYAYSKASGSGSNAGGVIGWQDIYRTRLNAYRKIS